MDMSYLIMSGIWSLVGFMGGYFLGQTGREIHEIKEVVMEHGDEVEHIPKRWHPDAQRFFGVAVILLSIGLVAQAWYNIEQRRNVVECQTEYNQSVSAAIKERGRWADEDRAALINFFRTIYLSPGDDDKELAAFNRLITTSDRNDKLRQENPVPELPRGDCR